MITAKMLVVQVKIDVQYDTVIAILYVSYCPAQIPSNMVRCIFFRCWKLTTWLDFELHH